jgi:hypothetical protein
MLEGAHVASQHAPQRRVDGDALLVEHREVERPVPAALCGVAIDDLEELPLPHGSASSANSSS